MYVSASVRLTLVFGKAHTESLKMSKTIFYGFLFLLVGSPSWAADPLLGVGRAPCSEILKINSDNPQLAEVTFKNWVVGYIAGKNAALKENRGSLGTHDAVWNGIISACVVSPNRESYTLRDASEDLYTAIRLQEDHVRKRVSQ